ncbi:uncharacterized protein VDAG_02349 [Verticillium dahliae VdLs.17]|uniref:Uncharacterized protein n=1 Tax=Verticillium dahliae (strain VdLs.17 / ATCC MYA-4575 / FGSC 10137) TaxID=498257 RepID=G2WXL7_VERDV|nr:uncharacterized protein VDAG_02349 [Verticillium dahliae VdLs.17]EGY20825.1 hypothetical protein VDAG_02349 [Verticillium dahliae VdLs.17]
MDWRHSKLYDSRASWARPIQIRDNDLMFEGKALSTLHEESREGVCRACSEHRRASKATGTREYAAVWIRDPYLFRTTTRLTCTISC